MTLTIPPADGLEFSKLKDECRAEIHQWLRAFRALMKLPEKAKIGPAIEAAAGTLTTSPKTVRRLWDIYRNGGRKSKEGQYFEAGDWRVFINGAKYPSAVDGLPPKFVEFWKKLCENNQRKCKPAWRALIRRMEKATLRLARWDDPHGMPWL